MSRRSQIISTIFFVTAGLLFCGIAACSPPQLLSLWLLYIALCTGGLGIVWTYRAGRSNGAFIIVNVALGFAIFAVQTQNMATWISVLVATLAGFLVAFQPIISPRIDLQFQRWDEAFNARTGEETRTSRSALPPHHASPISVHDVATPADNSGLSGLPVRVIRIVLTIVAAGAILGLRSLSDEQRR